MIRPLRLSGKSSGAARGSIPQEVSGKNANDWREWCGASLGSVKLWGTNRIFEEGSALTMNTGTTITNHVQGYSGGLDITNSAATPAMKGKIHVAFEQDPKVVGVVTSLAAHAAQVLPVHDGLEGYTAGQTFLSETNGWVSPDSGVLSA